MRTCVISVLILCVALVAFAAAQEVITKPLPQAASPKVSPTRTIVEVKTFHVHTELTAVDGELPFSAIMATDGDPDKVMTAALIGMETDARGNTVKRLRAFLQKGNLAYFAEQAARDGLRREKVSGQVWVISAAFE